MGVKKSISLYFTGFRVAMVKAWTGLASQASLRIETSNFFHDSSAEVKGDKKE